MADEEPMKTHKKISEEVFILVMKYNDPELGLDWMGLKPALKRYFKKLAMQEKK